MQFFDNLYSYNAKVRSKYLRRLYLFLTIFIVIILISIAGGREIGSDNDSLMYATALDQVNLLLGFEPGFRLIVSINNFISGGSSNFFYLYAFLAIFLKTFGIYKVSPNFTISFILYIGLYFILHEMMQIRIGLASGFIFFSFLYLVNQNRKKFILVSSIAVFFHYSTIISFVLLFLKPKKKIRFIYLLLPVLGLFINFFLEKNTLLIQSFFELMPSFISDKTSLYFQSKMSGELDHTVSLIYSLNSFLYFILLVFMYYRIKNREIKSNNDIALNLLLKIMAIQYFLGFILMFNIEFSNRVFSYMGVLTFLLIPAFAVKEFNKQSKLIIYPLIVIYLIRMVYISYALNLNN